MYYINLTPHPVSIEVENFHFTYEPSGTVCRVVEKEELVPYGGPIPLKRFTPIDVEGLPPRQDGVMFICSGMAAAAAWALGRADVICPSTDPDDIIRDERGFTKAVKAFKVMPKP